MSDRFLRAQSRVFAAAEKGDLDQALVQAKAFCRKNNHDYKGFVLQGTVLGQLARYAEARGSFLRALELEPDNARARFGLAKAYYLAGDYDEAIGNYRLALKLDAGLYEAHFDMGNALRIMGDRKGAEAAFRNAIAVLPDYPAAYFALSKVKIFSDTDADVKAMEDLLEKQGVSVQGQVFLHFSLAKAFEEMKDYDAAFEHLEAGNRINRGTYTYDISSHEDLFRGIKEVFTPALFERLECVAKDDRTPVFIIGMPRSGTTLVEQILSAHPSVYGAGELHELNRIIVGDIQAAGAGRFPWAVAGLSADKIEDFASRYKHFLRAIDPDSPYIVDKNPSNFILVGMIRLLFPYARVIHCTRDPVDTCLSVYKQYFSSPRSYAYDLVELGRYYRLYADLMSYWHRVLPGFILDICYEDVVADQRRMTESLLAYCGLPWDEACLEFYRNPRAVVTASADQVRQPIYKTSMQKWRNYEAHLAPLLEQLGE